MNIVINATCINGVESGAKKRFESIYNDVILKNPKHNFFILEPKDYNISKLINSYSNVKFIKTKCLSFNAIQRYFISILTLPKLISKIKADIYEQSHLPLIKIKNVKTIFTIHDIRYSFDDLKLNNFFRPTFLSNMILINSLRKSDIIVTVSETIKKEIQNIYKNNRTKVIYNPVIENKNKNVKPISSKSNIRELLKRKYFLSVGSFEKRKNYSIIIETAYLLKNLKYDFKFYIVGYKTKYIKVLENNLKKLELEDTIYFLHNISNSELSQLYSSCIAFIYPSRYEGFGIPLIEATHHKCKIILSDIVVFKEITENKGQYFQSTSSNDLFYNILNCVFDKNNISRYVIDKKILDKFDINYVSKLVSDLY